MAREQFKLPIAKPAAAIGSATSRRLPPERPTSLFVFSGKGFETVFDKKQGTIGSMKYRNVE